jgi:predicted  nucleic acid-binding Zn-ribbon protein
MRRNGMNKSRYSLNKVISRMAYLSVLVSGLLGACTTSGSTANGVNWIFLAVAVVLVIGLGILLGWLIKSGKFSRLSTAGINANKWKLEERKLGGQKDDIQAKKEKLISDLGKKAWAARVMHPSYAEAYTTLQDLDAQKTTLLKDIQQLETALRQAEDSKAKITSEYEKQLSDLQSLVKDVEKKIDRSQSQQSKLTKEWEKVDQEQAKLLSEIAEKQAQLAEVEAGDSPDKAAQVEALAAKIKVLEASLGESREKISAFERDLSKLEIEQQPFADQIERLNAQISTVEGDQREALSPLEERIAGLEADLAAQKAEVEALQEKMPPIIQTLGPLVESARPESEALRGEYQKIDQANANLRDVTQERHLITARLDTTDKGTVRNFYLMAAGLLILVVLIVVLFILAFV